MSTVIEDVRKEREDLVRVLKKHSGIRKIVEDLYPDSAHFIFELLQNAEDRSATEVRFLLSENKLRFEHNGKTFRPEDIYAITDIGEGTKAGDDDKIGRFGVGFKSVFAYSETPHIWSPTFSFKISDLVLPSELPPVPGLNGKTRFDFPFDNPKKTPCDAYKEIETGLNELAETTLLFLRHIESIKWQIDGGSSGDILRIERSDNHVEMMKQIEGQTATNSHFLKFDQPVANLEQQRIAIAFALDFLPNVQRFSTDKPLLRQLKIVPTQGQVAIFFPAAKEASGLRFHLHAPFVPELSRASIKETPANKPLFDQLAALTASSLVSIRDLGLLTTDFLGVLPNPQDQLGKRYLGIRNAIIATMNNEPLTPTYDKGHAPARMLIQAKSSLKELLGSDDIEFLIDNDAEPPRWAAARALQGTNVERFMNGIAIKDWDIEAFVDHISAQASEHGWRGINADFMMWLARKSVEWHQQFYALLGRESEAQAKLYQLKHCKIVRLDNGTYAIGSKCHFPDGGDHRTGEVPCVEPSVYSTGKSKAQQESARKFLADVGVTDIGERQLIEAILKSKYNSEIKVLNQREYISHMRRFMKLLDENPSCNSMLASYRIFMGQDNRWHKSTDIYLDAPHIHTGLCEYFKVVGASNASCPLADFYQTLPEKKITFFAKTLGARTEIQISTASVWANQEQAWLFSVGGERCTNYIAQDWVIDHFKKLVQHKSVRLARLIWNTMRNLPNTADENRYFDNPLYAVFRKNKSGGAHRASSQLVQQLQQNAWVPQSNDTFVQPRDARVELLPDGFAFDSGWPWIKAIEFGESIHREAELARKLAAASAERQSKEQEAAKALGFADAETARRLAEIPADELKSFLSKRDHRRNVQLPEHEPANSERRSSNVSTGAAIAPERLSEARQRSVSISRDDVKAETDQYLRQQYTNADAEQICQICKDILPFKLANGAYFFEAVEFLPDLKCLHYQNYICLCPNHSAMFMHANGSRKTLVQRILQQADNEMSIILAQQEFTIYFTKTHIADLKAVVRTDRERNVLGEGAGTPEPVKE